MPRYTKKDFPTHDIRRFLEPGPIVLVSSAHKDQTNIMTMGWHMVMEFSPSLVACLISGGNHSFELIRDSKQCVINIPTVDIAETVVKIGNCSGSRHRQICRVRPDAKARHACARAPDRRMLRQFRMRAVGCRLGQQVQCVRVRGGEGACRDVAETAEDDPLSRRRRVHDLGDGDKEVAAIVPAGDVLSLLAPLPALRGARAGVRGCFTRKQ